MLEIPDEEGDNESVRVMHSIQKELQQQVEPASGLWSYYADILLSNLFEGSIYLLANGQERVNAKGEASGPISDYFADAEKRMKFAKWFRPMALMALTVCIHVLLISAFQADLSIYVALRSQAVLVENMHDALAKDLPLLNRLKLSWTLCWLAFSAFIALAIQLLITAAAWFNFSKKSSAACVVASILSVGAVFVHIA